MKVKIENIKENPNNPRTIDYFKLEELKRSIKEFPEMLDIRPIVLNKDNVIIGGNMRFKAAKELGLKEIECEILDDERREMEFMVKDNLSYGEWNWTQLSDDYKGSELIDWGLDVPLFLRSEDVIESQNNTIEDALNNMPNNIPPKDANLQKNTKKALYLFYTKDEKEQLVNMIKEYKGELTTEDYILEVIRKNID